jgi:hypothetical protein
MRRFEVWVTLEEWEEDDKICDIETTQLAVCKDVDDARQLWDAACAHGLIAKDNLPIKVYDKGYGDGFSDAMNEVENPETDG